jgi:endo-1,4-beta-xylanase
MLTVHSTVELGSTYAKTTGMASYVKKWIAAGIPIDGIGAQAHLMAGQAKNVPAALAVLCAVASQCAITEMDIVNAAPADYVTAVKACIDIPNCIGVTVWGVRDPDSWRASNNPLLFNSAYAAKPAYSALVATLGELSAAATPSPMPTTPLASVKPTATSDSTTSAYV